MVKRGSILETTGESSQPQSPLMTPKRCGNQTSQGENFFEPTPKYLDGDSSSSKTLDSTAGEIHRHNSGLKGDWTNNYTSDGATNTGNDGGNSINTPDAIGTPNSVGTPRSSSSARKSIVQTLSKFVKLSTDDDDDDGYAVTPHTPSRDDDASYRSFGKGLSRRNSLLTSETVRTKALDLETTDETLAHRPRSFTVQPWELPVDAIKISKDAHLTSYTNVSFLCNGKNSNIYTAKSGGERVIIKKLAPEQASDERCLNEFKFEVEFLARATACESIVQILACGKETDDETKPPSPFIVLECLHGGSLTYMLTKKRGLRTRPFASNLELYQYMVSLASALKFCHFDFDTSVHVLHRDLKPDNVGFTEDGQLKLLDFGLSVCVRRCEDVTASYEMTGETGSLRYMAPEVIMRKPYNYKADVFSFGIVAWEMCTGVVPHAGQKRAKFIENVVHKGLRPGLLSDPYGQKIVQPEGIKEILRSCWAADVKERWSIDRVLEALIIVRDEEATKPQSRCVCV